MFWKNWQLQRLNKVHLKLPVLFFLTQHTRHIYSRQIYTLDKTYSFNYKKKKIMFFLCILPARKLKSWKYAKFFDPTPVPRIYSHALFIALSHRTERVPFRSLPGTFSRESLIGLTDPTADCKCADATVSIRGGRWTTGTIVGERNFSS